MGCVALVCQWFGQTLFPSITQHTCHCSPWEKGAAGATTDYSIPSLKLNVFVVQKSYSDNYFSIWHAVCVQNKYQDMPDFAFRFNLIFSSSSLKKSGPAEIRLSLYIDAHRWTVLTTRPKMLRTNVNQPAKTTAEC